MEWIKERLRLPTDRGKRLFIGMAIAIFFLAVPFLFYAYRLIPVEIIEDGATKPFDKATIFGITIEAGGHYSLNYYAYYFFSKMVIMLCFVVWYYTCRHWWRQFIIIPICMFAFQILGLVNTSISYIDEFDFWYSLPVVFPFSIILFITSRKWVRYRKSLDVVEEMEAEINQIKNE